MCETFIKSYVNKTTTSLEYLTQIQGTNTRYLSYGVRTSKTETYAWVPHRTLLLKLGVVYGIPYIFHFSVKNSTSNSDSKKVVMPI